MSRKIWRTEADFPAVGRKPALI